MQREREGGREGGMNGWRGKYLTQDGHEAEGVQAERLVEGATSFVEHVHLHRCLKGREGGIESLSMIGAGQDKQNNSFPPFLLAAPPSLLPFSSLLLTCNSSLSNG